MIEHLQLLAKAHKWARILGKCPGVRAIFLSGSVAQGRGKKGSDIDFFIIARNGQIWTARFFVFLVLKVCNQIATESNHAGKICPNHFITDNSLEIQEKDAYSAHLFSHNIPLYDPDLLNTFFVQQNKWVEDFGESFKNQNSNPKESRFKKIGNWQSAIENLLRAVQIRKIQHNPDLQLPGAKIILNDTELRFHPKPKNKKFRKS